MEVSTGLDVVLGGVFGEDLDNGSRILSGGTSVDGATLERSISRCVRGVGSSISSCGGIRVVVVLASCQRSSLSEHGAGENATKEGSENVGLSV